MKKTLKIFLTSFALSSFAIWTADELFLSVSSNQNQPIEIPQKNDFIYGTPFCHGPCMVRREAYMKVNGYSVDRKYLRVEDYDLWVRMYAAGFRGVNITEPLYAMRDDRNAYSRRKFKYRINEFRARYNAAKILRLPLKAYVYSLRPIIVGLLPTWLYTVLHKKRLGIE